MSAGGPGARVSLLALLVMLVVGGLSIGVIVWSLLGGAPVELVP
jgi:hypothetical protein